MGRREQEHCGSLLLIGFCCLLMLEFIEKRNLCCIHKITIHYIITIIDRLSYCSGSYPKLGANNQYLNYSNYNNEV